MAGSPLCAFQPKQCWLSYRHMTTTSCALLSFILSISQVLWLSAGHELHQSVQPDLSAVKFFGNVSSAYNIPGGYWNVDAGHTDTERTERFEGIEASSCYDVASRHLEPLSDFYKPRGVKAGDWENGVPKTFYRWSGPITRKDFDAVPTYIRGDCPVCCPHCTFNVWYKFIGGKLYRKPIEEQYRNWEESSRQRREPLEELLLVAAYLFKIPDADFIMHMGDGAPKDLPLLNFNINRNLEKAGFTMPSYDCWHLSLGPEQQDIFASCLAHKYPYDNRIAKAIWRGTSTDPNRFPVTQSNLFDVTRVRLHVLGTWYKDIMDAQLIALVQTEGDLNGQVERFGRFAGHLHQEDFNRYAVIIDLDGNGWSNRFSSLMQYNTLVLKQASPYTEWFGHLVAPGNTVEHYAPDLSDMVVKLRGLLSEWQTGNRSRIIERVQRTQGLAHALLNHVSVAEAMAYSVTKYAELADWKPEYDPAYVEIPRSRCCSMSKLPADFIRAVQQS